MKKRIVVTQVSEFLGLHFSRLALEQGYHVLGTGKEAEPHPDFPADIARHPNFQWLSWVPDRGIADVKPIIGIVHMGNLASPQEATDDPEELFHRHVTSLSHVLAVARRHRAVAVFPSFHDGYSPACTDVLDETRIEAVNYFRSPYGLLGELQRFKELWLISAFRSDGVEIRLPRIFDLYGAGMPLGDGRWFSTMVKQATNCGPVDVWGSEKNRYSLIHVQDVAEGLLRLLSVNFTQPLNLGSADCFTPEEWVSKLSLVLNKKLVTKRVVKSLDFAQARIPGLSRTYRALAWESKVPINEGLTGFLKGLSR